MNKLALIYSHNLKLFLIKKKKKDRKKKHFQTFEVNQFSNLNSSISLKINSHSLMFLGFTFF